MCVSSGGKAPARAKNETGFMNTETGVRLKTGESDEDFTKRVDRAKGTEAPVRNPVEDASKVSEAAALEAKRAKLRRGRTSTLLTSPFGVDETADTVKRKTLLGS